MSMVDYAAVMTKEAIKRQNFPVKIATEDMKGAYRQIPLLPKHVRFAVTAVYSPLRDNVDLRLMHGQPFGSGHCVPNFVWVSEDLQVFSQTLLYHDRPLL